MQLQIGKRYCTRNGLATGLLEKANNGTNYKFGAWVQESEHEDLSWREWLETGEFLARGHEAGLDLVEEIED